MQLKRAAVAAVSAVALGTIGFASASALDIQGGTIQYGQTGTSCDPDGVEVHWGLETDDNSVRSVRVSGIAGACFGKDLFVKVNGGATMSTTIDAASESFSLGTTYPSADAIHDVKVWIEG
ncbi:hypothetical protein [Nocardioides sp. YIM 152588]|uniref:hypothetical protein n=1 Tax=Nocardioides sp. YIM 152588 TaxID=3158259 RepID=UPI0032E43920